MSVIPEKIFNTKFPKLKIQLVILMTYTGERLKHAGVTGAVQKPEIVCCEKCLSCTVWSALAETYYTELAENQSSGSIQNTGKTKYSLRQTFNFVPGGLGNSERNKGKIDHVKRETRIICIETQS